MIKLVTFDVTNTLLRFRHPVAQVYAQAAKRAGLKTHFDAEALNQSFKHNFSVLLREHPNFGAASLDRVSSEDWWSILVERTLRAAAQGPLDPEEATSWVANDLFHLYCTQECWTLLPGVEGLLNKLRTSKIRLGVISNFDERLEVVLKANGVLDCFDFVVSSFATGLEKPDAEIFHLALGRVSGERILPGEALHVGDDYQLDYKGAKAAGWKALLLTDQPEESLASSVVTNAQEIEEKILGSF